MVSNNIRVQSQSGASGYAPTQGAGQAQALQQLMSTMDTNKSGSIDKAEFSQAAQILAKNTSNTSSIDAAFGKIDANGDEQISADELTSAMKQLTAQNETQKPHHHHHHHSDASASDSSATQTEQSSSSTQASSPMNEMQKNLFNKIIAAYGTSPALGTTSNLSA